VSISSCYIDVIVAYTHFIIVLTLVSLGVERRLILSISPFYNDAIVVLVSLGVDRRLSGNDLQP